MYEEILKKCKEWFYSIQTLYSETIVTDIVVDDSKSFIANIDSPLYLSQIVVSQPECRPYNFVEFTILDIRQDVSQVPVFWYGDEEGTSVHEIIDNLNKGLKLILEGQ
ncbi:MAG: hypothetical protein ACI4F4_00610 [Lachnospiraceae bacterium]